MRKRNRIETGRENKKRISLTITSDVIKVCWSHYKCCHLTGILSVVSSLLIHLLLKVDLLTAFLINLSHSIRPWQSVRCSMSSPIFLIRLWVVLWQNHKILKPSQHSLGPCWSNAILTSKWGSGHQEKAVYYCRKKEEIPKRNVSVMLSEIIGSPTDKGLVVETNRGCL